jgi:aspartate racemase
LVGVLGGMGPSATVDFYDKLVRHTPAGRDQDHLAVVIWADPTVPSRQEALLTNGVDPTPWLEDGVRHLMASGAQLVVAPCNTVHAFLRPLMADQPVEFIDIIDTTVAAIRARQLRRVGLLATDGALASGLFQDSLDAAGIEWVLPSPEEQRDLMSIVESVKAGRSRPILRDGLEVILANLLERGVGAAVAGCTEVSALFGGDRPHSEVELIDPALELALETIARATR